MIQGFVEKLPQFSKRAVRHALISTNMVALGPPTKATT